MAVSTCRCCADKKCSWGGNIARSTIGANTKGGNGGGNRTPDLLAAFLGDMRASHERPRAVKEETYNYGSSRVWLSGPRGNIPITTPVPSSFVGMGLQDSVVEHRPARDQAASVRDDKSVKPVAAEVILANITNSVCVEIVRVRCVSGNHRNYVENLYLRSISSFFQPSLLQPWPLTLLVLLLLPQLLHLQPSNLVCRHSTPQEQLPVKVALITIVNLRSMRPRAPTISAPLTWTRQIAMDPCPWLCSLRKT